MASDRTQRATRLTQLRQQLAAIQAEIARLEAEDVEFTAYLGRARAAGQSPITYADFAKYTYAFDQLQRAWVAAGRPATGWDRLTVLNRVRELLLIPASIPAGAAAVTPAPAVPVAASQAAPTAPASAAVGTATVAAPSAPVTPVADSQANGQTEVPAEPAPEAEAANEEAVVEAPPEPPPAPKKPWSQAPVPHDRLLEMHSPILTEVVDLTKRAADEVKSIRISDALQALDRATWYLERVVVAPPALSREILKVLETVTKSTAVLTDTDRSRLALVQQRATTLVSAQSE